MRDEKLLISSKRYLYIFQLFEHSYEFESFYELPTYANHIIQLPEKGSYCVFGIILSAYGILFRLSR